jgi:pimeloyl-ACP methyl ester carboxylesterase
MSSSLRGGIILLILINKMEININGIKTNYLSFPADEAGRGEGKPFLILHGWNSASDRWITEAEIIAKKGFKVIVPDLPGFGESEKLVRPWRINDYVNWFEEFIEELKINDFYLLGYSFGGAVASKITLKYPQRVQKLFLVASAVIRKKTTQKGFSEKIAKFIKFFNFLPFYNFFRKVVYRFIIRKSDYVYAEGIMKETYLNIISDDISYKLSYINVPTIIIWGDKDESVPIEDAKTINSKIKSSKLVIIPEADHLMHKKIPEILAEKIVENL